MSPTGKLVWNSLIPMKSYLRIKTLNTKTLPEELPISKDEVAELDHNDENTWQRLSPEMKKALFKLRLREKKTRVSILQISEFLIEYLRGTKMNMHKAFLALCP